MSRRPWSLRCCSILLLSRRHRPRWGLSPSYRQSRAAEREMPARRRGSGRSWRGLLEGGVGGPACRRSCLSSSRAPGGRMVRGAHSLLLLFGSARSCRENVRTCPGEGRRPRALAQPPRDICSASPLGTVREGLAASRHAATSTAPPRTGKGHAPSHRRRARTGRPPAGVRRAISVETGRRRDNKGRTWRLRGRWAFARGRA